MCNMPSELQSQTSRLNGAKSRGPRTDAGKSNAARSRYTHGMLSKTIVIEGENASRFTALLNALRDELQPQSGIEDGLVEDLATCRWRQRRLLSMETACLTGEIRRQDPEAAAHSNAGRAVIALSSLSSGTRALDLINRYELRFKRQYNRTLQQLFALRALKKNDSCPRTQEVTENNDF